MLDVTLYVLYLALASTVNYTFSQADVIPASHRPLVGLLVVFTALLNLQTLYQLVMVRNLASYLRTYQLYTEICWYVLTYAGCAYRLRDGDEAELSSSLMALATVFSYIKATSCARPFHSFGVLIGIVEAIAWEIKYFLLLLLLIVYGFSQALFLASWVDQGGDNPFGRPETALLQMYQYLNGGAQYLPQQSPLAVFLLAMFTLVSTVVLLNMLISMMSDVYSRIKAQSEAEWRRKMCQTLVYHGGYPGIGSLLPPIPRYIHFLRHETEADKASRKSQPVDAASTQEPKARVTHKLARFKTNN